MQLIQKAVKAKRTNHKIARLIITGKECDKGGLPNSSKLRRVFDRFVAKVYHKQHFEFIITPGGFLRFLFPKKLQGDLEIGELEQEHVSTFLSEAEKTIKKFLAAINCGTFRKLQKSASFLTIGIDGHHPSNYQHIELVALYDLPKEKIIQWTGKFYPTEDQKRDLIKIKDLNSHFTRLNKQNVVILGCHDLNVFHPRGQAAVNANSSKGLTSQAFRRKCRQFRPDIILHHPHTTDTPDIWNLPWRKVEKEIPHVQHFASGIKYYYKNGEPRGDLDKVLAKTKKGDVIDFPLT